MKTEAGFTVAEMLAALFVLSLSAMAIGPIVANFARGWEKTDGLSTDYVSKLELIVQIADYESAAPGDHQLQAPPALETDFDTFLLASPKIQKTAECVYDLVGRRCQIIR